ncbi:MAG TPA: hypothetical protein VGR13_06765, partial [Actinomycetota bacterium]|nr:hypothetical protein [Actinomycetota bacterium]
MRTLKTLTLVTVLATVLGTAHLATAAELDTSELAGVVNDVTVTQGSSSPFTIDVSASGAIDCSVTPANPATAKVDTQFSISAGGSVTGSDFSSAMNFFASGTPCSGNNPITWTGAPTHYSVAASVSAAAATPVGVYNLTLSVAAGTTQVTNPNQQGGKLADTTATTIRFRVVAPSDTTPPVITRTVSGTLGSNDWFTSDVTVAWSVADPESAVVIDSGCGTQNFTTETTGVTSSCQAHSAGGSSTDSVNLKIDKTGPVVALSVTGGTLGSNGWYTSDVTVHTSGSDAISDNVSCTSDQLQTSETAGTDFHGSCTNDAGLTGDAPPLSIKLDRTPPIIDVTFAPPQNADGWNRTDVLVSYSCQDALSGIDTSYNTPPYASGCPSDDLASSEGLTSFVNRSARDLAGNLALVSPSVRIDNHAPTISQGAIDGTVGANGWYTSDVTVHFTAFDGLSGLRDPGDAAFTLAAAGEGASVPTGSRDVYDRADNVATAGPLTFQIDKHPPTIICGAADGSWHQTDVSIACSASDTGGSGLADSGDASFSLSTNVPAGTDDPDAATGSHLVCDVAGNCATAGPISGNKVDKKAPAISCDAPDGAWHNSNVSLACTAVDGGSGLANPTDAAFSLSTDVPDGSETANA